MYLCAWCTKYSGGVRAFLLIIHRGGRWSIWRYLGARLWSSAISFQNILSALIWYWYGRTSLLMVEFDAWSEDGRRYYDIHWEEVKLQLSDQWTSEWTWGRVQSGIWSRILALLHYCVYEISPQHVARLRLATPKPNPNFFCTGYSFDRQMCYLHNEAKPSSIQPEFAQP